MTETNAAAFAALLAVARAAARVDRDNLDAAEVHPCDEHDDRMRRQALPEAHRALSEALDALPAPLKAAIGLIVETGLPARCYEIVIDGAVVGVTTRPDHEREIDPGAAFAEIPRDRFAAYGDAPWETPTGRRLEAAEIDAVLMLLATR